MSETQTELQTGAQTPDYEQTPGYEAVFAEVAALLETAPCGGPVSQCGDDGSPLADRAATR